jgi:hypothetical protein
LPASISWLPSAGIHGVFIAEGWVLSAKSVHHRS